jgi:Fur family ferric uptake transcriptional regulator
MKSHTIHRTSRRLSKKSVIFQILKVSPHLSASELQQRAQEAGVNLTSIAAYRALKSYRDCGGKLEMSDNRCMRLVSAILQEAEHGVHLSAKQIAEIAGLRGLNVHQASVYRSLLSLRSVGLVLSLNKGGQRFYEWRREEIHHGHLTCIECGKTIEFYQDYLDDVGRQICARMGYEFDRIEFIVRSQCQDCRGELL